MNLNFCLECAAPLTKQSDTHYICADGHDYWNNAKGAVALAFVKDGMMLFSKRGRQGDPNFGMYDLPGGFIEFGQTAQETAVRECLEETAATITTDDLKLLAVYHNLYTSTISSIDVVFLLRHWEGEFVAGDDSAALEWKPLDFIYDDTFCEKYYTGLDTVITNELASGAK